MRGAFFMARSTHRCDQVQLARLRPPGRGATGSHPSQLSPGKLRSSDSYAQNSNCHSKSPESSPAMGNGSSDSDMSGPRREGGSSIADEGHAREHTAHGLGLGVAGAVSYTHLTLPTILLV